jgi:hypothetical protein
MNKSDIHELLAQLYLRMNGYFTTGFIVHSPEWGQARTEVDCLAVRHSHHCQPERQVGSSEFLGAIEGEVDLILCEVKSDPGTIGFNKALREDGSALASVLQWSGLISEQRLDSVVDRVLPLLRDDVSADCAKAGVLEGMVRVRPLTCCPPATVEDTKRWCLLGDEIFQFLEKCFNPAERRDTCSTRYNFQQWGYPFELIVRYIKDVDGSRGTRANLEDLYKVGSSAESVVIFRFRQRAKCMI